MTNYVLVDPSSKLDWSHDWSDWLAQGDSIVMRQWSISPIHPGTPLTPALTGDTTPIVFVEGMMAGNVYRLTEQVTTLAGLVDERTIVIRCEDT
jgi:hypothetical protein